MADKNRIDIELGQNKVVRVEKDKYKGNDYIDVRKWYYNDSDELKPTPKGIKLNIETFDKVVNAIKKISDIIE